MSNTIESLPTAKQAREALKEAGFNQRKVSVKHEHYSLGSSLYFTVRDASVDVGKVRGIASQFESISRCQHSGEILGGGNRYVHVNLTDEVQNEMAKPFLALVAEAVEKAESEGQERVLHPIGETGYLVQFDRNSFHLWKDRYLFGNLPKGQAIESFALKLGRDKA